MVRIALIIYSNDLVELACEKNDEVIKVCRAIKGRWFNPANCTWAFPLSELEEVKEKLADHDLDEKSTEAPLKAESRVQTKYIMINPKEKGFEIVKKVPHDMFLKLKSSFKLTKDKEWFFIWSRYAELKALLDANNFKIRIGSE